MLMSLHLQPRSLGAIPEATCDTGARVMSLRPDQDWLATGQGGQAGLSRPYAEADDDNYLYLYRT